jgi:hypothetical protein
MFARALSIWLATVYSRLRLSQASLNPGRCLAPPKIQRGYEESVRTSSQPCITAFQRFRAIFNSLSGVYCDLLSVARISSKVL